MSFQTRLKTLRARSFGSEWKVLCSRNSFGCIRILLEEGTPGVDPESPLFAWGR